jgi:antirestriction protein ArdC
MTHWTCHPTRLNRDFGRQRFGDAGYAMEELVAEIGSAYLSADLGITPEIREDHAAYVASWLEVLRNDKRAILTAASHAERAADHLQSYQAQEQAAERPELTAAALVMSDPAPRARFQQRATDRSLYL